jgi:hypothetical protein
VLVFVYMLVGVVVGVQMRVAARAVLPPL